jgi:hypothetical protein
MVQGEGVADRVGKEEIRSIPEEKPAFHDTGNN